MTSRVAPLVVFIDVDDTFVRSFGTKRMPIPSVVQHVRELHQQGADLYCWSSGGAEYARTSAHEFGIEDCFTSFLPKPQVLIDDQPPSAWNHFLQVHPLAIHEDGIAQYRAMLQGKSAASSSD